MAQKERVLTENQKKFLDVLVSEAKGDFEVAKTLAGYAETTRVSEIVSSLREEILRQTMDGLIMNGPKAVAALQGLLSDPVSPGAANVIKVAGTILDRMGAVQAASGVNLKVPRGGIVILPAKGRVQEAAIEDLEDEDDE